MKSLEFLTTNFSETTRLFFQNAGNAKKAQLPVRVEEQEAFFGTMTQLSATLKRLDGFLMDSGKEINFQETVAEFVSLPRLSVITYHSIMISDIPSFCVGHARG